MKFRFVGGLDCPDWVLAEIASLSKLSVIKFKNWCSHCQTNLIAKRVEWSEEQISSLNSDRTLDDASVRAMLAALMFVLRKSAKNACSPCDLEIEMQQLGLPAEHCKQLARIYAMNFEKLRAAVTSDFMRAPSVTVGLQGTSADGANKVYILNFCSSDGEQTSVAVDSEKLHFLQKELSEALQIIRPYVRTPTAEQ